MASALAHQAAVHESTERDHGIDASHWRAKNATSSLISSLRSTSNVLHYPPRISALSHQSRMITTWLVRACIVVLAALIVVFVPNNGLTFGTDAHSKVETHTVYDLTTPTSQAVTIDSLIAPILFKSWDNLQQLTDGSTKLGSKSHGHRLIFIGDIHGCIDELNVLLKKVDYDAEKDHIITTGDMVNKGPDSAAVVDLLHSQKASCVRGNHDHKILRIRHEIQSESHGRADPAQVHDIAETELHVARSLSNEQVGYLQACPVILHIGEFQGLDLVVVHAGLVPSVPFDQQSASDVMNMRIIDVTTQQASPKHQAEGSVHWYKLWNKYQDMSPAERLNYAHQQTLVDQGIRTVVYGHDAKKGLQIHKYTRGLDSKCVAGGKLTALVMSEDLGEQIFQVDCKEYVK